VTSVAVSGAGGRMGRLVVETIVAEPDLELGGCYDPECAGEIVGGVEISDDPAVVAGATVVVEFTRPDVVLGNLETWRELRVHAVVGTSGFDEATVDAVRRLWGEGPPHCLIAPNFSVGAVIMMRLAEIAAPHFAASEIIELHHDAKADAPSGTALATAARIAASGAAATRAVESVEKIPGVRGGVVSDVNVHAVRLPGLVAHQEVVFGGPGETLRIRHDTTDRASFMPGVLLAVRSVAGLSAPVTVGLETLLGL
jgi:4-hydroxy-tetrahydrodipicolinate reductase